MSQIIFLAGYGSDARNNDGFLDQGNNLLVVFGYFAHDAADAG